jgi:hypothetical protein
MADEGTGADEGTAAPGDVGRRLSRGETHDLSMIIKDRTKVLKAHADEQAAACLADFEKNLAAQFDWDQDAIWKAAAQEAEKVARESQEKIARRAEELGIPRTFAPRLGVTWQGRGENAVASRREELRRVAKSAIEAMRKAAVTKIEKQSLDLRTQVVAMGLLSADAKMFLESLAPVEEAMRILDFGEIERRLEKEQKLRLADRDRLYGRDF